MRMDSPFDYPRRAAVALLLGVLLPASNGSVRAETTRPADGPSTGAPVVAGPEFCLNIQPPSRAEARSVLADLRDLGVRCVRASWWTWSTPESWSWCPTFQKAGIEVLPLVYDQNGDYRQRFRALSAACGPFRYVQLGNEMDGGLQPGKAARDRGRLWGRRVRDAAPLVRATGARVVGPGLAWNSAGVHHYLDGLLEGAGDALDVVAIHTYGIHVYGEPVGRWKEIRAHGWKGPIWITEVGVSNDEASYARQNTDEWQRRNLEAVLRDPALPGLGRLYWFQYTPAPQGWGLRRMDGTRRPAFEWLRRRAAQSGAAARMK
ncbi:MAG: glycoside hydrolase family protein [Gemmatimonadota bacterium]|nr:glycoside hydrolase family protein [Gemmatimonadota bacterium]